MIRYLYGLLFIISSQFFVNVCVASQDCLKSDCQKILVFGDSLSAAYNMPIEKGWVSLLQNFVNQQKEHKRSKIVFANASISGETTSGGLARLKAQLKKHQPDIIIIELAGNDGLRGFNLKLIYNNLKQMITMSKNAGSKVLLSGIRIPPNYGRTYTKRFEKLFSDLAKEQQTSLIPFILDGVATKKEYMQADGIHPNEKGQPIIVKTVWQYLKSMLEKN